MRNYHRNTGMTTMDYIRLGLAAVAVTGVSFLGWKIYKSIRDKAEDRQETKEARKELDKSNVRISDGEAKNIADIIYNSLNTNTWDDTTSILDALSKLQTPDDWKLVVIKFGKRKRDTWFSNVDGGIDEWLYDALKSYEMTKVKDILSKIGVTI